MARMDDGFSTLIEFSDNDSIKFYEKEVTPPGVDAGGENDTTTMRNTAWRTRAPKKLKTLTDAAATVAWDPAVYEDVVAMVGINQEITITFPDLSTLVFWGWLDSFKPNSAKEGEQPTAAVVIKCSNLNDSGAETAPDYTAPPPPPPPPP